MTHLGPSLRRAKVRERPGRRAAAAMAVSVVLNALGLLLLARAGAFHMVAPAHETRVGLAPVSAAQWASNRAIRPGAQALRNERPPAPFAMPHPPPKPEPEPPKDMPGQVVDVAPSKDPARPRDTPFVSDRDNTVEKQTISRHRRAGYERTLATPSAPGAETAPPPGQDGRSERSVPGLEGRPPVHAGEPGAPKVALAPEPKGDLAGDALGAGHTGAPTPAPGAGEGGERLLFPPSDRRLIAPGTLARVAGGPAPDHVTGIEEGEGTFLNTRGWKYATYFNRIKQAIAAAWDPLTPLDKRDPDRSMFGRNDRFTLLGVTLDDAGHVKNLVVEQTSGVEFLDRAALTAFRAAEPFVNPPKGIVDGHGEIKFSFGFFLEMGRPGLRVYRAPIPAMP